MDEPLLTAEEVAARLNVRPSTVYDAVARGRLPAVRLWRGRRRTLIRFSNDDLRAFIESRRTVRQAPADHR
jgi:excisionase family DNA binding protein